jgi:hypothetical protein
MLVRENISNFERTGDPIKGMGIGREEIIKKILHSDMERSEMVNELVIKYKFFKTKKEAKELLYYIWDYEKNRYKGFIELMLFWYINDMDIKFAEEVIHLLYLFDENSLNEIIQILVYKQKEELFKICQAKYGQKFIEEIKKIGTYITGVGWREHPDWYNQILYDELKKTNYLKKLEQKLNNEIKEIQRSIKILQEISKKKNLSHEELIKMASHFENYKSNKDEYS